MFESTAGTDFTPPPRRRPMGAGAPILLALLGLGQAPCQEPGPAISGDLELDDADLLLMGTVRDSQAGLAVAIVGDINADGYDDMVVGAPGESGAGDLAGAAHLVYGPDDGLLELEDANAHLLGYVPRGYVGKAVSSPGDVNGDGYDDVLIGSGTANEAYLFYGPVLGTVSCANADVRFTGTVAADRAGSAVAGIGDVNDDGYPDIAIGASGADAEGLVDRGAVYLFWGGPSLTGVREVASAPVTLLGTQAGELAGTAVAGAGDVNADGIQDLLIGAPGYAMNSDSPQGAAYLVMGPIAAGVRTLASARTRLVGEVSQDSAGSQVSSAGDADADGLDDFLVGARKNDLGGTDAGAAYLVYGSDLVSGTVSLYWASVKLVGEAPGDSAGFVSRGGDLNRDGFSDVVIGANASDAGGTDAGAAYVLYGPLIGSPIDLSMADARIMGVSAFDQAGYGVGGGGDIDLDGFHDIIVGAIYGDGLAPDVGTAGVFFGGD